MTMASFSSISLLNEFEKKNCATKRIPPLFSAMMETQAIVLSPRVLYFLSRTFVSYILFGDTYALLFPDLFLYAQQQNKCYDLCTYVLLQFVENMLPKTPCFPSFSLLLPIHMIFFCCKKGKASSSPDFILSSERTEMRMQSIHITINNT